MHVVAEQALRLAYLVLDVFRVATLAERDRVRERVIADPMPRCPHIIQQRSGRRIEQVLSHNHESRIKTPARKDVENLVRHAWCRPVVKRQGYLFHDLVRR